MKLGYKGSYTFIRDLKNVYDGWTKGRLEPIAYAVSFHTEPSAHATKEPNSSVD